MKSPSRPEIVEKLIAILPAKKSRKKIKEVEGTDWLKLQTDLDSELVKVESKCHDDLMKFREEMKLKFSMMVEDGNRLMKILLNELKICVFPKNSLSLEEAIDQFCDDVNITLFRSDRGFLGTTKNFERVLTIHEIQCLKMSIRWSRQYSEMRRRLLTKLNEQEGANWLTIDALGRSNLFLKELEEKCIKPFPLDPLEYPESLFCRAEDRYQAYDLLNKASQQVRKSIENASAKFSIENNNALDSMIAFDHEASKTKIPPHMQHFLLKYADEAKQHWQNFVDETLLEIQAKLGGSGNATTANIPSYLGTAAYQLPHKTDFAEKIPEEKKSDRSASIANGSASANKSEDYLIAPPLLASVASMAKLDDNVLEMFSKRVLPFRIEEARRAEREALLCALALEEQFLKLTVTDVIDEERKQIAHDRHKERLATALEIAEFQRGVDERVAISVAQAKVACLKVLALKCQRVTSNAFSRIKREQEHAEEEESTVAASRACSLLSHELKELLVTLQDPEEVRNVCCNILEALSDHVPEQRYTEGAEQGGGQRGQALELPTTSLLMLLGVLHEEFSVIKHKLNQDLQTLLGEG